MSKKNVTVDLSGDKKYEDRKKGEVIRDDKGKITGYSYNITIKGEQPFKGELSREEMEKLYRMYSFEGANLQARTVSREFPRFTLTDIKRLLTAFKITKSSLPFAPHQIDEMDPDKLVELNLKSKEASYLKKYEDERTRAFERMYRDKVKEFENLKKEVQTFKEFVGDIKIESRIQQNVPEITNNKTLMVYLSDMHIGAHVSNYSLYGNEYNEQVVTERMQKVYDYVTKLAANYNITNVVIVNVGDSLDGYNGQTTRGGHSLPQNLDNKDQYKVYVNLMLDLFKSLSECGLFSTIKYYCVGTANHDGDFGYITNKALEAALSYMNPNIEAIVFDKNIDHFKVGDQTFILTHGKDAKDMFKNMPLTLNDKTENYINQYINYHKLTGKITFIKGDLHMSAKTYGNLFGYKSVGSFFGSSDWIQHNFGLTRAAVDIDILDELDTLETRLEL